MLAMTKRWGNVLPNAPQEKETETMTSATPHDRFSPSLIVHGNPDGGQPAWNGPETGPWEPLTTPSDPHDDDYDVGDGPPDTGPVADNVHGGGPGPFSKSRG
jgi:hypothetical protein